MAIRLFAEGQYGVLGFAQDAMRNRLGRFTLGNLQGGGGSALFFLSPLSAADGGCRQFQDREVTRLGPWISYVTMDNNVVYKVKAPMHRGER
jgi:hypothetical protein